MKKPNIYRERLLHRKREKKRLKRLRKPRTYFGLGSVFNKEQNFRVSVDKKIVAAFKSPLYSYLVDNNFITGGEKSKLSIPIPKEFSLSDNYDKTIETVKDIIYSLWKNVGKEIEIDFTNCQVVDQSALFLLQILRLELSNDYWAWISGYLYFHQKLNLKSQNLNYSQLILICFFVDT